MDFGHAAGGKRVFPASANRDWLVSLIKRSVKKLGLNPTFYSGHSLRASGATDLLVARVPYFIVKKYGRWKSDVAMIYYRDDEDMKRELKRALGALSCMGVDNF